MSNLTIYKESKQLLSNLDFVVDIKNQIRIAEIKDVELYTNQLAKILIKIIYHLGIKNAVSDLDKQDVSEMILMRFKQLSLDEIQYAFKLDRYGVYDVKTDHYQLFNADYVSQILNKYLKWKQKMNFNNNLISIGQKNSFDEITKMSQEKILELNNFTIIESLNYFIEHRYIDLDRIYVYDILFSLGYLPKDKKYKERIYKEALESVKLDLKNKKSTSVEEKRKLKSALKNVIRPKEPKVILKSKEFVLSEFFRNLTKDEAKLNEFIKNHKL